MTFLKALRYIVTPLVLLIIGFAMILKGIDYGLFILLIAALFSIQKV